MTASGMNAEGTRLYMQGEQHAAMQKFQEALAADPRNPDGYYNLAAVMHQVGKQTNDSATLSQAEGLYNQCLDRDANHVECHRGLAALLVDTGRSDKAFTLMERWTIENPKSVDARVELARLYEEFGDKRAAQSYLEQALAINTTSRESSRAWTALARLREESGDHQQALANYQQSYQLNSFQPGVAQRIAHLRQSLTSGSSYGQTGGTRMVSSPTSSPRY